MDHLCLSSLVFVVLSRLFTAAFVVTSWERVDLSALVCDGKLRLNLSLSQVISWIRYGT